MKEWMRLESDFFIDFEEWEVEELIKALSKLKSKTEFVLERVSESRDDDTLLWFLVNWIFNRNNFVKLAKLILWLNKNTEETIPKEHIDLIKKVLSKIHSEDSISRCRRKIQHDEGKFPASEDVELDRRRKEKIWKKASKQI